MRSNLDNVLEIRSNTHKTSKFYIDNLIDNFIELHGDRISSDDRSVIAGIGMIDNIPVTVIGQERGTNTKDRIERNFGLTNPSGYRKAYRLMKLAEKFNRSIVIFIDTMGAACDKNAEANGIANAIANNIANMFEIKVPIIIIIIGEAYSGGALALAIGDRIYMLEDALYSVISPEGMASIVKKDIKKVIENINMNAEYMLKNEIIDRIIENDNTTLEKLKVNMIADITTLSKKMTNELLNERYLKFNF